LTFIIDDTYHNLKSTRDSNMPRVSRRQSELNRSSIKAASARLFRERGIRDVSVADLMAEVGLTHGGFYGHFASKDVLAAEACGFAFEKSAEHWNRLIDTAEPNSDSARTAVIERYVSASSRNNPGSSCPAVALAADVSREPTQAPIRATYAAGIESLLQILANMDDGEDAGKRDRALTDLCMMVGALSLARATAGRRLSDEILAAARKRLTE
jgi:TetR/AcrR family transcriptional repressor of nem operon